MYLHLMQLSVTTWVIILPSGRAPAVAERNKMHCKYMLFISAKKAIDKMTLLSRSIAL
jgi:hypothetical protein